MPRLDRIVSAFVLLLLAAMTVAATGYQYEARLMPLVIGVPSIVLAAIQCFRASPEPEPARQGGRRDHQTSAELTAMGWLTAFVGLVVVGGVLVGGAAAVVVTQRIWLRETWRTALIGGALSAGLLVAVFERQLGIALFQGLLLETLR